MNALFCINFPLETIEDFLEYYKEIQNQNYEEINPFFVIAKQVVNDTGYGADEIGYGAFLEALMLGTNTTMDNIVHFEHYIQHNDDTPANVYQHLFLDLLENSAEISDIYAKTKIFCPALPRF